MEITPQVDMSDYDKLGCLHEMFISQADKTPTHVAIVTSNNQQITFKELNDMSDVLASLLQKDGVTINKVVGILMERCPEYVVAVIAIHKAGGAYLPLEVSYPQQLLDSVIEDSKPLVICTKKEFMQRFQNQNDIKQIYSMDDWKEQYLEYKCKVNPYFRINVSLDDLAYTVYSSGTTGKPKGIQCPHRGAVFSYTWRHRAYPYEPNDREACNIFYVWEMLRPLLQGMPMYVIPDDVIYDPPRLAEFIRRFKITRMLFTPSLLQAVIEFQGLDLKTDFKSFRQIWFCGEVVTTALRDKVANLLPWIQLLNLYSISECHDVANSDISKPTIEENRKFCPVGKIFPKVHVVVMDEDKNVKKIGEPGEIYIGGPTLAIGYLNRPEMNAERFIETPKHVDSKVVGSRLYKTGDWGYMLADGNLEISGRCDSAVRIRGYNVELQMVEKTLLDLPEIAGCSVLAYGKEDGDKYVVAFVVLNTEYCGLINSEGNASRNINCTRNIRMKLKERLPIYMIPVKFEYLDKIPILEASGKLDKKALMKICEESISGSSSQIDFQGQNLTKTQIKVAYIWAKILNLISIDVQENFFDLGGHSLAATRLISEINEEFNLKLNVRSVFQHPTIEELSAAIDGDQINVQFDLKIELDKHLNFIPQYNDLDKRLSSFWKSMKLNEKKLSNGNVLLTGATGFIGSHLLNDIISKTRCIVYCIVRETPNESPVERILNSQKYYRLSGVEQLINDRVIPLKGDMSLLNFGLSEEIYTSLSYDVDVIIHGSAKVNLILPYHALYKDNVVATKNVILFALTNKIKFVNYISTNAVFPNGIKSCKEEDDMKIYMDDLNSSSGYSQTKWLSEQLIKLSAKAGLPTVIYRCGNVGGSVERPNWNPSDFILFFIQAVIHTESAPDIDWKIELTPIDFVSQVIVALVFDINSSSGRTFHLINGNLLHCRDLWAKIKEIGYGIQVENYDKWLSNVSSQFQLEKHYNLLQSTAKDEDYFVKLSEYRNDVLECYLKSKQWKYPEVSLELFSIYLKNLAELNFISKLPKIEFEKGTRKPSSVSGVAEKVVLVTGGSSGIGAGIAIELAMSEAKVAIIARRIDKLEKIKCYLESNGVTDVFIKSVDVMDCEKVYDVIKDIETKWGPIDVLVNNAGCMYYNLMEKCAISEWKHMVQLNCIGTLNCLSGVLKSMTKRNSGHIITITSDAGRKAFAGLAVYSGTKFFLEALNSALRLELSDKNIKVTSIQPGDVESELRQLTTDTEAADKYDFSKSMEILKPSDIGKSVVFAISQPSYCAINEILIEPLKAPI